MSIVPCVTIIQDWFFGTFRENKLFLCRFRAGAPIKVDVFMRRAIIRFYGCQRGANFVKYILSGRLVLASARQYLGVSMTLLYNFFSSLHPSDYSCTGAFISWPNSVTCISSSYSVSTEAEGRYKVGNMSLSPVRCGLFTYRDFERVCTLFRSYRDMSTRCPRCFNHAGSVILKSIFPVLVF